MEKIKNKLQLIWTFFWTKELVHLWTGMTCENHKINKYKNRLWKTIENLNSPKQGDTVKAEEEPPKEEVADTPEEQLEEKEEEKSVKEKPEKIPVKKSSSVRCSYWPNCPQGDKCKFWHPKKPCK